jgi:hypothetical protein
MLMHKVKTHKGHLFRACCWSAAVFAAVAFGSFNVCMREEREKMGILRANRMKHLSEAPDPAHLRTTPKALPSASGAAAAAAPVPAAAAAAAPATSADAAGAGDGWSKLDSFPPPRRGKEEEEE